MFSAYLNSFPYFSYVFYSRGCIKPVSTQMDYINIMLMGKVYAYGLFQGNCLEF